MHIEAIDKIMHEASGTFASAVNFYWPSFGNNEVPEANLVLAASQALGRAGFHVWNEVAHDAEAYGKLAAEKSTIKRAKPKRVDSLAIDPASGTVVWMEAKRLYSAEKATLVTGDITRINSAKLNDGGFDKAANFEQSASFGVVLASVWNPPAELKFWIDRQANEYSGEISGYQELETTLARSKAHLGSVKTSYDADWGQQHFLYAIWLRAPKGAAVT